MHCAAMQIIIKDTTRLLLLHCVFILRFLVSFNYFVYVCKTYLIITLILLCKIMLALVNVLYNLLCDGVRHNDKIMASYNISRLLLIRCNAINM